MMKCRSVWSIRPTRLPALGTVARDPELGAGVLLAATRGGGAVGDDHLRALLGGQPRRETGSVAVHDLAGVRVVGGHDDQRVAVLLRELQRLLRRPRRAARSHRSVRRRRPRGPSCRSRRSRPGGRSRSSAGLVVREQVDRLAGHRLQLRHLAEGRLGLAASRPAGWRPPDVASSGANFTGRLPGREQAEQRLVLVGASDAGEVVLRGDVVVAARLGLLLERLALPRPGLGDLREGRRAAAQGHVGTGVEQLLADRAAAAVLLGRLRARGAWSPPGP